MKTHFRSSAWLWCSLLCLLVVMTIRFGLLQQRSIARASVPDSTQTVVPVILSQADSIGSDSTTALPPAPDAAFEFVGPLQQYPPAYEVVADTLDRNDSIYLSLRRHHISDAQIVELNRAMHRVFDSRTESQPRDHYLLRLDTAGVVQRFEYVPHAQPERPVLVERLEEGEFVGKRLDLPLTRRTEVIEVHIEDNLSNAINSAGESDALTDLLADDIFGSVVDFHRDPRRGDRISLIFEKLFQEDRFIRYGHILLARYEGQVVSQLAVHFTDDEGYQGYYDAGGKSLARMFLLYALPSRRITSGFNPKRFHPVLKRTIPHLGTDYGSPVGTPVHATARGRVIHAGWKGSLGKAVIIEHPNGYVTRYGHLSKVLVRKGQRVQQKQRIGRVGATGRVTGPHLHYEIIKNGRHLNPETINKGSKGTPLAKSNLAAFAAYRDSLLQLLETRLAAVSVIATSDLPTSSEAAE